MRAVTPHIANSSPYLGCEVGFHLAPSLAPIYAP